MNASLRYIGMIALGLLIVLIFLLAPIAMRLQIHGRSAVATVLSVARGPMPRRQRSVVFELEVPQGFVKNRGLTWQMADVGSKLVVVYLPNDPLTAVPVDDPATNPTLYCLFVAAGSALVFLGAQGIYRITVLARVHAKNMDHLAHMPD